MLIVPQKKKPYQAPVEEAQIQLPLPQPILKQEKKEKEPKRVIIIEL